MGTYITGELKTSCQAAAAGPGWTDRSMCVFPPPAAQSSHFHIGAQPLLAPELQMEPGGVGVGHFFFFRALNLIPDWMDAASAGVWFVSSA